MDWITLLAGIVIGFLLGALLAANTANRRLLNATATFISKIDELEKKLDSELNLVNEDIKKIGHKLWKMENVE